MTTNKPITAKSNNDICQMITGHSCDEYGMYVKPVVDRHCSHALYNVPNEQVDFYKGRIKELGGKYIRSVRSGYREYKIICFSLRITP